jgi:hypothetical protein
LGKYPDTTVGILTWILDIANFSLVGGGQVLFKTKVLAVAYLSNWTYRLLKVSSNGKTFLDLPKLSFLPYSL